MVTGIILLGIAMGVAFAAPPGVVTAETLRRGVRGGFTVALGVQMGSLIGDAAYALIALAGLTYVAENHLFRTVLGAAGAMFLMYLAWSAFAGSSDPSSSSTDSGIGSTRRRAFLAGMALSLGNPWAMAFWISLGGILGTLGIANASNGETGLFFVSFMLGSALWALVLSFAIAHFRRWIQPKLFRLVSVTCGLALGLFAAVSFSRVVASVIGL